MAVLQRIDTERIKSQADLRVIAEQDTTLSKTPEANERKGPCPVCDGDDRFMVQRDRFYCRQCRKGGDQIEYMKWAHNADFRRACEMLSDGDLPEKSETGHRQAPRTRPRRSASFPAAKWVDGEQEYVTAATEALWQSEEAMHYLRKRGLDSSTWRAYGLGYTDKAYGSRYDPAIVIPWYQRGRLVAVKLRRLSPQIYPDKDGNKHEQSKLCSRTGSKFVGRLYGGHVLPEFVGMAVDNGGKCAEAGRTLVICEGELNAMSIWQVAGESDLDVLSLGSESARLPAAFIPIAGRYGHIFTWLDEPERARGVAKQLPGAHALSSPGDKDANDLLQAGTLGAFLTKTRQKACSTPESLSRLYSSLYDSIYDPWRRDGVDEGTGHVMGIVKAEIKKLTEETEEG